MSNKYKTVTVFESVVKAVKETRLSDAEKGRFYSAYMEYFLYGTEPVLKGHGKVIFELVRPSVDMSIKKQKNNGNYYHNKVLNKEEFSTDSVLNKNLNQSDFSTENGTDSDSHARRVRVRDIKERDKEKTPLDAADLSLASLNLNHPKNTGEVVAEAEKHCVRISESQAQDFIDANSVTAQGETWMFRNTPVRDWRKLMNSRWITNWKRDNEKNGDDEETPDVFRRLDAKR